MRITENTPAHPSPKAEPRDHAAQRGEVLRQLGISEHIITQGGADDHAPALVTAWFPSRPLTRSLVLSLPVLPETCPIWEETTYLYRITTGRQCSWLALDLRGDGQCGDYVDRITAYPVAEYLVWCPQGLCVEAWPDHLGSPDVPTLVLQDGAELALQDVALQVSGVAVAVGA